MGIPEACVCDPEGEAGAVSWRKGSPRHRDERVRTKQQRRRVAPKWDWRGSRGPRGALRQGGLLGEQASGGIGRHQPKN